MQKKTVDGLVAVLYSPGYGAGWFTFHKFKDLLFDPKVVEMVQCMHRGEISHLAIENYCKKLHGYANYRGAEDLKIAWLPQGTEFMIKEYDGDETIATKREVDWIMA